MAVRGRVNGARRARQCDLRLDEEPWRERRLAALRAHRSQVDDAMLERFRGVAAPWREHYICVYARVPIRIPEADLFTAVPGDIAR